MDLNRFLIFLVKTLEAVGITAEELLAQHAQEERLLPAQVRNLHDNLRALGLLS